MVEINKLSIEGLKEELDSVFSEYLFDIEIKEIDSYMDIGNAWEVKIIPKYEEEVSFEIHVEEISGYYQFEYAEDIWEHIDDKPLFRYMFFKSLVEIRKLKKRIDWLKRKKNNERRDRKAEKES